jgi:hypothetical protein
MKFVPMRAGRFGPQTPEASLVWDDIPLSSVPVPARSGIYYDGVPADLVDKLERQLKDGEKIRSVSIAADNTWVTAGSETSWSTSPNFADSAQTYWKAVSDNSHVSIAALGNSGCQILIFGANGYNLGGYCLDDLTAAIEIARKANGTMHHIVLDAQDRFVIVYDGNGLVSSPNLPTRLQDALMKINHDNETVDQVALGANDGLAVVYDAGSKWNYFTVGMANSFNETIQLLFERGASIQALAVQPKSNAWVIVAPN